MRSEDLECIDHLAEFPAESDHLFYELPRYLSQQSRVVTAQENRSQGLLMRGRLNLLQCGVDEACEVLYKA